MVKKTLDKDFPDFSTLKTSTRTILAYTNVIFDRAAFFKKVELTSIDVPLTKKQKNTDKKKIEAPYGAIISVSNKTMIRGVNMRKKTKLWCTVCRPVKVVNEKEVKVFTVNQFFISNKKASKQFPKYKNYPDDVKHIRYYCSNCDKTYIPTQLKKINHFLNQIGMHISIGGKPRIHVMFFEDKLKLAGCKSEDDAVEVMLILFQDYLPGFYSLKPGEKFPQVIFENHMHNVKFKLGFKIDREALNTLMNLKMYEDKIRLSIFDRDINAHVRIKMPCEKTDIVYSNLFIPYESPPYFKNKKINKFKKNKKLKQAVDTFMVFESSEVIISGKDKYNMRKSYEFFVRTVLDNRHIIEKNHSKQNINWNDFLNEITE